MGFVEDPSGNIFPDITTARWNAFFERVVGEAAVSWYPEGAQGLPAGFEVKYPDGPAIYGIVCQFSALDEKQWRHLLTSELPFSTVVVLDGQPASRMYLTPDLVFDPGRANSGPGPDDPQITPIQYAESLAFKPPIESVEFERFGLALASYKDRPWWDEYCNFFLYEEPDELGADVVLDAVNYAMTQEMRMGSGLIRGSFRFRGIPSDKELASRLPDTAYPCGSIVVNIIGYKERRSGAPIRPQDLFGKTAIAERVREITTLAGESYKSRLLALYFLEHYGADTGATAVDREIFAAAIKLVTGPGGKPMSRAELKSVSPASTLAQNIAGVAAYLFSQKIQQEIFSREGVHALDSAGEETSSALARVASLKGNTNAQ